MVLLKGRKSMQPRLKIAGVALAVASVFGFGGVASATRAHTATAAKASIPIGLGGISNLTAAEISKWKALVTAAQTTNGGNLVVMTSHNTQEVQYWNQFQTEFGLHVTLLTGSPTQISTRIL